MREPAPLTLGFSPPNLMPTPNPARVLPSFVLPSRHKLSWTPRQVSIRVRSKSKRVSRSEDQKPHITLPRPSAVHHWVWGARAAWGSRVSLQVALDGWKRARGVETSLLIRPAHLIKPQLPHP